MVVQAEGRKMALKARSAISATGGGLADLLRSVCAVFALLAVGIVAVNADERRFSAGVTRITIQDVVPFDVLVAYPTMQPEASFQMGPFTIMGRRDAAIVSGSPAPIVLFSHGNGRTGGAPLIHHDLITSLARAGFVVVAPYHPGTLPALEARPRHVHKALNAVLADPRFTTQVDPARIGMIGFSFGGAVAIIVAGGVPSLVHLSDYCRNRSDDPRACDGVPSTAPPGASRPMPPDALVVKALVLMEPLGALFDAAGLKAITAPTLIVRAAQSDLNASGNIFALAQGLPSPPKLATVAGGHFVFVGPCPAALVTEAPAVCDDAQGVDRVAIHRQVEAEIVSFLRQSLN
jgi:predicted dienelactone hydrolase